MQEIKKRRIVIASLLKPVNDTRMFEKIGLSLTAINRYEVHLIGIASNEEINTSNIQFHPIKKFKRISFERIVARLKILKITIQVKPEALIVTTSELLIVTLLNRILFGSKICYDVQENYWRNIMHNNAFPKLFRLPIATWVRFKETLFSPFVSQFLLAEKCYADELSFIKKKYVIVENKCKVPSNFQRKPNSDFIEIIFTGTLSNNTGILESIELAKKLHAIEPKIQFTIIGYSSQPKVLQKIKDEVDKNSFIKLIGGDELVPHSKIMDAISTANFGIVYYPLSPQVENKIPTKLYEYLSCELPILLQNHKPWMEMCEPFDAAITIDFNAPDVHSILNQMHTNRFYISKSKDTFWESEEQKLIQAVDKIFS